MQGSWPPLEGEMRKWVETAYVTGANGKKVRKTPSWPRSWANFSLL
jgi:hypothetical protein